MFDFPVDSHRRQEFACAAATSSLNRQNNGNTPLAEQVLTTPKTKGPAYARPLFNLTNGDALRAAHALTTVVAEVAIAVANADGSATVAAGSVDLEL